MQSSHGQLHQHQMSKHHQQQQQQQHLQQASYHPYHFAAQQQQALSHHPHQQPPSAEDLTLFTSLAAYADALDALPLDLTRSFSDLRELDAVLGAHITSLTTRLRHLTSLIEDPLVTPGERLVALKEVAEEARAYKMGGEDKIRVAVNTADIIVSHTEYIDSLLDNLNSVSSLSPYVDPVSYLRHAGIIPGPSGDLNFAFPGSTSYGNSGPSSRGAAAASSAVSFSASAVPGYVNGAAPDYMGSLPTKTSRSKKVAAPSAHSSLTHAAGASATSGKARDSSAAGGAASATGAPPTKKRRPPAGSSSASKAARLEASHDAHSAALAAAVGTAPSSSRSAPKQASRNAPHAAGSPAGGTNVAGGSSSMMAAPSNSSSSSRAMKNAAPSHRDLPDEEEEMDDEAKQDAFTVSRSGRVSRRPNQSSKGEPNYAPGDEEDMEGGARRVGRQEDVNAGAALNGPPGGPAIGNGNGSAARLRRGSGIKSMPGEGLDGIIGPPREGLDGIDPDTGEQLYCFCNRVSYGEMIGCDDDDCKREWFHIGCLGLDKPPSGTWYCEDCLERRRKSKKGGKSGGASGGRRR